MLIWVQLMRACDGFVRRVGCDCESLRLKRGGVEALQAIGDSLNEVYDQAETG